MSDLVYFCLLASLIFGSVFVCSLFGRIALKASVVINLSLIAIFAQHTVDIFGFTTNIGSIFYAGVFLAMMIIVQNFGLRKCINAITWGAMSIAVLLLINGYVIGGEAASVVARNAMASISAFLISQYVAMYFYNNRSCGLLDTNCLLRTKFTATCIGQAVDSIIFYPAAFLFIMPLHTVIEITIVGYLFKVALSVIDMPFFYSAARFGKIEKRLT